MENQLTRQRWSDEHPHERRVERLYGYGAENYGEFHGGYLNFGLWTKPDGTIISNYVEAAKNLVRHVANMARLDRDSRLLDVACGYGVQDILLMNAFGCKSIDALDATWAHVQELDRRACKAGHGGTIRAHHGTATDLSRFPPESFTHVICIEGVAHFDTRAKFLDEAFDLLEPGGVLVMADYLMKRPPMTLIERAMIHVVPWLWHMPAANVMNVTGYTETLVRVGFTDVRVESAGDHVIPGYFVENQRPQAIAELRKIRGVTGEIVGRVLDHAVYQAYKRGLCDYVFVRAVKPAF